MSILLPPNVDDATASDRLYKLELSLKELEINMGGLSAQQALLQQKLERYQEPKGFFLPGRAWLASILATRRGNQTPQQDGFRSISKELHRVDSALEIMHQRHRRLSFSLEIYKEILAPISRIPFEILQEIFRFTIPPGFVRPSTRQSPLLLTAVCRRWQSIALATPTLWSSISTTSDWPLSKFLPQQPSSYDNKLARLFLRRSSSTLPSQPLLWIKRAGRTPFHMEITIPKQDLWFGTTDPYYHWVMQTSERWFHLRLAARSINLALLLSQHMSNLETLELVGIYDRDYDFFMLRTHFAEFDLRPETYSFPWSSLTTLEAPGTWFIVDQLITVLKGSPNLRSCAAKIQDLYTVHEMPYHVKSHLIHNSLTKFRIYMNDRESYALRRLLDSLSLTSLTTLQITNTRENSRSDWPHIAFIAFLQRSLCPMRRLRLAGFSMLSRMDIGWEDPGRVAEIWTCLRLLESFEFL